MNLEPDRWPVGVPEGATHRIGRFSDCDNGPTKSVIMGMKGDPRNGRFWDLCFGKREPVELYDCEKDPDQVNILAQDPSHAKTVEALQARLSGYLKATADPRFTDAPVRFDEYRYR